MIKIVGLNTNEVYAKGTRADCFRELHEKYPHYIEDKNHHHGRRLVDGIYPEPLMVVRA